MSVARKYMSLRLGNSRLPVARVMLCMTKGCDTLWARAHLRCASTSAPLTAVRLFLTIYAKNTQEDRRNWYQPGVKLCSSPFCICAVGPHVAAAREEAQKRTRRDEIPLVLGVLEPLEEACGESQGGGVALAECRPHHGSCSRSTR